MVAIVKRPALNLGNLSRFSAQVLASLGIETSTYTPTLTNVANLDASTANADTMSLRVGNLVTVFGTIAADPTTAGVVCQLGVSLLVASDLTIASQLGGAGSFSNISVGVRITGDATNNRALFEWNATTTANANLSFIFGYRVL